MEPGRAHWQSSFLLRGKRDSQDRSRLTNRKPSNTLHERTALDVPLGTSIQGGRLAQAAGGWAMG